MRGGEDGRGGERREEKDLGKGGEREGEEGEEEQRR